MSKQTKSPHGACGRDSKSGIWCDHDDCRNNACTLRTPHECANPPLKWNVCLFPGQHTQGLFKDEDLIDFAEAQTDGTVFESHVKFETDQKCCNLM